MKHLTRHLRSRRQSCCKPKKNRQRKLTLPELLEAKRMLATDVLGQVPTGAVGDEVREIGLALSAPLMGDSARDQANFELMHLGDDGVVGGGDDTAYPVLPQYVDGSTMLRLSTLADLSAWSEVDYAFPPGIFGEWTTDAATGGVAQTLNGSSTFFVSDSFSGPGEFRAQVVVDDSNDDDFVGVVFGFDQNADTGLPDSYFLLSWKKQSSGGAAAGLKLAKIEGTGELGERPDLWSLNPADSHITILADGPTAGWESNVPYEVSIDQGLTDFTLTVTDATSAAIWETTGANDAGLGRVGFYNFSQPSTRYWSLETSNSLPLGAYQIRVTGDGVLDANGEAIDGDGDGQPGGDYVRQFQLVESTSPTVINVTPAPVSNQGVSQLQIELSEPVVGDDARTSSVYQLLDLGPDGEVGGGDDLKVATTPSYSDGSTFIDLATVQDAHIDLSLWQELDYANGSAGDWRIEDGGSSVKQYVNATPTFFVSDFDFIDEAFTGRIRVEETGGDDDFIGLVFGLDTLEENGRPDSYYFFSWKQGDQLTQSGLYADAGMKLLRVTDVGSFAESDIESLLWEGLDGDNVEVLASNIGSSLGWRDNVEYDFSVSYPSDGQISLSIRESATGTLVWDASVSDAATLGFGKVGFLNHSQSFVRYSGLERSAVLRDGAYRLSATSGNPGLRSTSGVALDGDNDGVPGGDFVYDFVVDQTAPSVQSVALSRNQLSVTFDESVGMDELSASDVTNYSLKSSGGDGTLGDETDLIVDIASLVTDVSFDAGSQTATLSIASGLPDELYEVSVAGAIQDLAGNPLEGGDYSQQLTLATTSTVVGVDLQASSDSGASDSDNITNMTTPTFDVSANKAGLLELFVDGDEVPDFSTILNQPGQVSYTTVSLVDDLYNVRARLTPVAGTAADTTLDVMVDTQGPYLLGGPETEQAPVYSRTVQFSEPIDELATAAGVVVTLTDSKGQPVAFSDLPTGSGDTYTFTFGPAIEPGEYTLSANTAITDLAGNLIDQDQDGVGGEVGEDEPVDVFEVLADVTSPFVTRFAPLGPRNTNVTQFEIDFSEAINAATFTPEDVQIQLPDGGIVSPTSISAVDTAGDRYFASFATPLEDEGDYSVSVGPGVEDLSGNLMGEGGWVEVQQSDFEGSISPLWSSSRVISNPATSVLLGNFGSELVNLSLEGLPNHSRVRVNWDLLLIDTWDGNVGGVGPDFFGVEINGSDVVWEHTFTNFSRDQSFPGEADERGEWFEQNRPDALDSLYRGLQVEFADQANLIDIGFFGRNLQSLEDESWAIDNVRVEVLAPSGPYQASFTIDKTGPSVVSAQPSEEVNGVVSQIDLEFDEAIAPNSLTVADVALTGPVGAIAVQGVQRLGDRTYRVSFAPQRANGDYQLTVGPDVLDRAGNVMDQDGNGTPGEVSDAFSHNFTIALPDLLVEDSILLSRDSIPLSDSTFAFGESIDVSWSVLNDGEFVANSSIADRVYLSTDDQLSADDLALSTVDPVATADVSANQTYDASTAITVPLDGTRTPGTFYLIVKSDAESNVVESDETNNWRAVAVELVNPPLPDLVAGEIAVIGELTSGEDFTLAWEVTNPGESQATGSWTERIYVGSDEGGAGRQLLDSFTYNGPIDADADPVERSETLTLPVTSLNGPVYFFIEVDATNNVIELDEENLFASDATYDISADLVFSLAGTSVTEGGSSIQATLTRNGDVSQPLVATLSPSVAGQLDLPATVTIPAGQYTKRFNIGATNDDAFDGNQQVVITARATDYPSAAAILTAIDNDQPTLTLTLPANELVEGGVLTATVTREVPAATDIIINIASSDDAQLDTPLAVVLPQGEIEVTFQVTAVDDTLAEREAAYSLNVSATGHIGDGSVVTIPQNDVPSLSLNLPGMLAEGSSGPTVLGTITRDVVTDRALVVELSSADGALVSVPATVTIPAGQASVTFPVVVADDGDVNGDRSVNVTARVRHSAGGAPFDEGSASDTVEVLDNDGEALTITIARDTVAEGKTVTATIRRNTADVSAPLTVALGSDDLTELSTPSPVEIPIGAQTFDVVLSGLEDDEIDGDQVVTVMAQANGFSTGTASVVVVDINLPDLVVTSLSPEKLTALTGETIDARWVIANLGFSPAEGTWTQRIYISSDATIGNDTLAGQYTFTGPLGEGQDYNRSAPVRMPTTPGDYWLVLETDVANTVGEGLETNNARIIATPITVSPAYTATVMTDVEMAPADTPVLLTGTAASAADGSPAAFKGVSVHINVRGTKRVLPAVTDAAGAFQVTFTPLLGEGGSYTVGAAYPGLNTAPVQDSFKLVGMRAEPPADAISVIEADPAKSNSVTIRNLADVPLTGLRVEVLNVPANLQVTAGFADGAVTLAEMGTLALGYTVAATDPSMTSGVFELRVTSNEAPAVTIPVSFSVVPLRPRMSVSPGILSTGVVRGSTRYIEFEITNTGGKATGPVTLAIPPQLDWVSVANLQSLANILPGATTKITLQLLPASGLPLNRYKGSFILRSEGSEAQIPFAFSVESSNVGSLAVIVEDELTYFTEEKPNLTGATLSLTNKVTGAVAATGTSDENGRFEFSSVPEGYYDLKVRSPKHNSFVQTIYLEPGQNDDIYAFLPRETVTIDWSVVPIEIEDRTQITVQTTFETSVPAPVVTVSPAYIDFTALEFTNGTAQIELTLSNQGLIAAENVSLNIPNSPQFRVTPLVSDIGVLPAKTQLTVPVMVEQAGISLWDLAPFVSIDPVAVVPDGPTIDPLDAFGIAGVSTSVVEQADSVTLHVVGGGFDAMTQFHLTNGGDQIAPTWVAYDSDQQAVLTFNLLEAPVGEYDLVASSHLVTQGYDSALDEVREMDIGLGDAVLANAVEVRAAGAAEPVHVAMTIGELTTDGRGRLVEVAVHNGGRSDVAAPILQFASQEDLKFGLASSTIDAPADKLPFAILGADRPQWLAPGETVRVKIVVSNPSLNSLEVVDVKLLSPELATPFDIERTKAYYESRVATVDWDATWDDFLAVVGTDWRSASQAVVAAAEDMGFVSDTAAIDAQLAVLRLFDAALAGDTQLESLRTKTEVDRSWVDALSASNRADVIEIGREIAAVFGSASTATEPAAPIAVASGAGGGSTVSVTGPAPKGKCTFDGCQAFVLPDPSTYEDWWTNEQELVFLGSIRLVYGIETALLWAEYLYSMCVDDGVPTPIKPLGGVFVDGNSRVPGFRNAESTERFVQAVTVAAASAIRKQYPDCDDIPSSVDIVDLLGEAQLQDLLKLLNFNASPAAVGSEGIPGLIAGGIGSGSEYTDSRSVSGRILITKNINPCGLDYLELMSDLNIGVQDTIDFCPGNLGGYFSRFITEHFAYSEANNLAYDVPFSIEFNTVSDKLRIPVNCDNDDCGPCEETWTVQYSYVCRDNVWRAFPVGVKLSEVCEDDHTVDPGEPGDRSRSRGGGGLLPYFVVPPIRFTTPENCKEGEIRPITTLDPFDSPISAAHALVAEGLGQEHVCAVVKLQIDQEAIQTRDAFEATLAITNNSENVLTDIGVDIQIVNAAGDDVTDLFGIQAPELSVLTGTDGTGTLGIASTGTASWIIIPSTEAAPGTVTEYFVSGALTYNENGTTIVAPLVAVSIMVYPQAELDLDYFLQRDVFSDDPFTDEIEPAQVFTLAVHVQNNGAGAARNLRIESAQPKIIENEKGLLIDFEITGTKVNGGNVERSLTANFGNVTPGQIAIAEWQMESSLQGLFIDYDATFQHISPFGDNRFSLIKSVEIHEMIHVVDAQQVDGGDGLPDFLVNDLVDPDDLPDTLYLSDGSIVNVGLGSNAMIDAPPVLGDFRVDVTADMTEGWSYLKMNDPSLGDLTLIAVERSDGAMLPPENFWQTDRTFIGGGQRPIYEDKIHLLDYEGTGSYTFVFSNGDLAGPDVASFAGVAPNPTTQTIDVVDVTFTERLDDATLDASDITLTKNGETVALAGLSVAYVSGSTYRISGLASYTADDAVYELMVDEAGVTDQVGNSGEGSESYRWVKGEAAPTILGISGAPSGLVTVGVNSIDIEFSKPIVLGTLTVDDLSLTRDGTELINAGVTISQVGESTYRVSGLGSFTAEDGDYQFTADVSGVEDAAGNTGLGDSTAGWTLDSTAPELLDVIDPTTNPRNIVVQQIDIEFSEPIEISTLDVGDLTLVRDGGTENLLAGDDRVTFEDRGNDVYRIRGINWVQAFAADPQVADFTLIVDAAGISDTAGNMGTGILSSTWTVDLDSPTVPTNLVLATARGPVVDGMVNSRNATVSGDLAESGFTVTVLDITTGTELAQVVAAGPLFSIPIEFPSVGQHDLRIRLTDAAGNTTDTLIEDLFVTETPPLIESITGVPGEFSQGGVDAIDVTFVSPVDPATLTKAALQITRNGGANLVNGTVSVEAMPDGRTFRFNGLSPITTDEGLYDLAFNFSSVENTMGLRSTATSSFSWLNDTTGPTSSIDRLQFIQSLGTFAIDLNGLDADLAAGVEGSGVASYDLYVSDYRSPFQFLETVSADVGTTTFIGEPNQLYVFRVVAHDAAGNVETKPNRIDAWTYIPDLFAPATQVNSVDTTDATFEIEFSGTDRGDALSSFDLYVLVDSGDIEKVATVTAGAHGGDGVFSGSYEYQAISDGAEHEYRFFTVGVDKRGNRELAPDAPSDVTVAAEFAAPVTTEIVDFDVQNGAAQRSFLRYLDVFFNTSDQLSDVIASLNDGNAANDRIQLTRYELDGSGPGDSLALAGRVSAVDQALELDFGEEGIGGNRNSAQGDGYYSLKLDLDGDGSLETELNFYRLLGDSDGDGDADNDDLAAISAAMGQIGENLDGDLNGDGRVNIFDRQLWFQGRGNALAFQGDFDSDNDVDGADFLAWQRNFGTTNSATVQGDADHDQDVDGDDLKIWDNQFGYGIGLSDNSVTFNRDSASNSIEVAPAETIEIQIAPESFSHIALVDAAMAIGTLKSSHGGHEATVLGKQVPRTGDFAGAQLARNSFSSREYPQPSLPSSQPMPSTADTSKPSTELDNTTEDWHINEDSEAETIEDTAIRRLIHSPARRGQL